MVRERVRGIDGVLQTLLEKPIGVAEESRGDLGNTRRLDLECNATGASAGKQASKRLPVQARRGRPPTSLATASAKQKVTVRIRSELIQSYRDWSWEARSSLSCLVERALIEYRDHRKR